MIFLFVIPLPPTPDIAPIESLTLSSFIRETVWYPEPGGGVDLLRQRDQSDLLHLCAPLPPQDQEEDALDLRCHALLCSRHGITDMLHCKSLVLNFHLNVPYIEPYVH